MGAIWEIFDLLGVQIDMSGGFEITETLATEKLRVDKGEQGKCFQGEKGRMKGPPGIRVPLRVEDEIWDGESNPKSRLSECEAEQLQVESQPDDNCNNRRFSGDVENNNNAGKNDKESGEVADHHQNMNAARKEDLRKRKEIEGSFVGGVVCQESELDETPSRILRKRNCKTSDARAATVIETKAPLSSEGLGQDKPDEKLGLPFLCPNCGKRFRKKEYLNRHIRDQHMLRSNQSECVCHQCGKEFRSRMSLKKHKTRYHPVQGFPCKHAGCTKVSMSKSEAGQHKAEHKALHSMMEETGNQSKCMCQHCGKVVSCMKTLRKHMKCSHPIQGFPCKHVGCTEVSMSKSEAIKHNKAEHILVEKVGDVLTETQTLPNPRTETDGGSLNACKLCGKSFRERSSLNEHKKRCKTRCSNYFSSEEEMIEKSSIVIQERNPDHPKELNGSEVENDEQAEESPDGQHSDERENEIEICESEDQGETAEASVSESAAQREEDENQYRACPFCAKAVPATRFDKHVRKHQPITRAFN